MTTTAQTLIAEFGTREIPLDLVCVLYFGMTIKAARNAVALGAFPLPTYRAGGVKSPLLVRADDLARLLDDRYLEARERWNLQQGMSPAA